MIHRMTHKTHHILAQAPQENNPMKQPQGAVPIDFVCPLTLEVFTDPLMSKYGHNFERQAILEWLAQGSTGCPITRQPLTPSMLFPNASLRVRVRSWQRESNLPVSCVGLEESSCADTNKLVISIDSLENEVGSSMGHVSSLRHEGTIQRLHAQRRLEHNPSNWIRRVFSTAGPGATQRHE